MADVIAQPLLGLRERKKQRTRAMLVDAAVTLCIERGYGNTTVEQIAAAADVRMGFDPADWRVALIVSVWEPSPPRRGDSW